MKKMIMLLSLCLTMVVATAFAQTDKKANKDTQDWHYEVEPVAVGVPGTYLIKIWSYSKNPVVATEQAKKNAIHAVVFRGFSGKPGIAGKPPLLETNDITPEKQTYFDKFFSDGGTYMKFATLTNDGAVAAEDRLKLGKEYKIGVMVSVNVKELRLELENAGIIKSLGSRF